MGVRARCRAEMQLGLPTRVASNTAEPGGADPAWAAPPSPLGERGERNLLYFSWRRGGAVRSGPLTWDPPWDFPGRAHGSFLSTISFQYALVWRGFSFKHAGSIRGCPGLGLFQAYPYQQPFASSPTLFPGFLTPPLPYTDLSVTTQSVPVLGWSLGDTIRTLGIWPPRWCFFRRLISMSLAGRLASPIPALHSSNNLLHHCDAKNTPLGFQMSPWLDGEQLQAEN